MSPNLRYDLDLNAGSTLYLVRDPQQVIYLNLTFINGNKELTVPSSAQLEARTRQACQVPGLEANTRDTLDQDQLCKFTGPSVKQKWGLLVNKLSRWQKQSIKPSIRPFQHKALGTYTGHILLMLTFFQAGEELPGWERYG